MFWSSPWHFFRKLFPLLALGLRQHLLSLSNSCRSTPSISNPLPSAKLFLPLVGQVVPSSRWCPCRRSSWQCLATSRGSRISSCGAGAKPRFFVLFRWLELKWWWIYFWIIYNICSDSMIKYIWKVITPLFGGYCVRWFLDDRMKVMSLKTKRAGDGRSSWTLETHKWT